MIELHVPSLAERKDDLPLLTRHSLEKFSDLYHKGIRSLTQARGDHTREAQLAGQCPGA